MALIVTQTDVAMTASPWSTPELLGCSGRGCGACDQSDGRDCAVGGTAGSGSVAVGAIASEAANVHFFNFAWIPGAGITGSSGTWTVRINITTANMNLTITEIYICRAISDGTNQETIGSVAGLSISLGTTGVKSQDVTGGAVTIGSTDYVLIVIVGSNSAMTGQSFAYTPTENINSPFSAVTPSLLWDRLAPIRPHIVRKVRDFFLGGLPPKLARLRMIQNRAGLYVPSNDPQFLKKAA